MKKKLVFWLLGLILSVQVFAQTRTISGTVTDAETGEALIGVNVTGKGTDAGTVTDIDGNYTLELSKEVTALVFSYVGFTTIEKPITSLVVNAAMGEDAQLMDEVIITGMQIKREKRSTTYSTNTVSSEDLNKTATNMFSALQSKTPGVRISSAGGAVGASNRIVLDGEASFLLGNNALIVVDGIPINNNTNSGNLNDAQNFVDFGNRGNDFDPDNIESISVLKGPAATALYGSRASSGVVIITTKSGMNLAGEDKKFNVTVSSGITFDKAYLQIKRQDQFGQGYDMAPDPIENFSWGPALDGIVRPWTPVVVDPETGVASQLIRPYSAVENQLQNGLNTGVTYRNGLSIEGGGERFGYYFSYFNTSNTGIFDNTFYKRHALAANVTGKLSEKLTSRVNVQYSKINQRALLGAGTANFGGPFQALLQQAVNIPLNELRDYNSLYQGFLGYYGGYTANPYYLMNNLNNDSKVDNILASTELEYKPIESLAITARVGTNFTVNDITQERPQYAYTNPNKVVNDNYFGSFAERLEKRNNLTVDLIASFNKEVVKNFSISALAGYNLNQLQRNYLEGQTQNGLTVPGFYNLSNSIDQPTVEQFTSNYRLLGIYGQVGFSYKNMIHVEYTARNDWSSTLPQGNNNFFYQSGGINFIPTELIKGNLKKWVSYAKLRFNVGTQGKDATPYLLASTNSVNPTFSDYFDDNLPVRFPLTLADGSSLSSISVNNRIGNPNLKPELTLAYEAGVDLDILKDYIHLEYSFRHRTHKDLIVIASMPASSGYTSQVINIGEMRNVTNELLARVNLLKNIKGINWDIRYQFSKTNNEVLKANVDANEFSYGTYVSPNIVAVVGQPFGTFKVNDYQRTPEGNLIVGPDGLPTLATTQSYAGSFLPDYTMGWGTSLSWKGLAVDVQFDMRQGGVFYSGTREATTFNGTSLPSLLNDRQPYIIPGSVVDNGDGTYSENTVAITNIFDITGNTSKVADIDNMIDASYIKLREASISYTFDKKYFKNTPLSAITIALVGRNLKFWLPKENTFADPESNSYGQAGNEQGVEFSSSPTLRSFGFDIKVKF